MRGRRKKIVNCQFAGSGLLKRNWLLLGCRLAPFLVHLIYDSAAGIKCNELYATVTATKTGLISCEPIVLSVANEFDVILAYFFPCFFRVCRLPLICLRVKVSVFIHMQIRRQQTVYLNSIRMSFD